MSDFLKNLVGRSLGTLEVVQPRVPSIFEPYRRGSGSLGTGSNLHVPSAPSEQVAENDVETEASPQPKPAGLRIQAPTPMTRAATREGREGRETPSREQQEIESVEMSEAAPLPTEPSAAITQESVRFATMSHTPGRPSPDPMIARKPATLARPAMIAADRTPSLADDPAQGPQPSARRSAPASLAHRQITPIKSPPIRSAVRPPIAPRSEGVRHPERSSIAAPPAIDVTIGKVEVRAIFPEPAPRSVPPAQSRPTVSLDEYLNRRNGGKR